MRKKIKLSELNVQSFVTSAESNSIQGGILVPTLEGCISPVVISIDYDCSIISRIYKDCGETIAVTGLQCNIHSNLISNCNC